MGGKTDEGLFEEEDESELSSSIPLAAGDSPAAAPAWPKPSVGSAGPAAAISYLPRFWERKIGHTDEQ